MERVEIPVAVTRDALGAHAPMLRRYLRTLGVKADHVDDLVQEAFVTALQKQPEDRGPAAIASWLRGVARNLVLRERRSDGQRREVELCDEVWQAEVGDGDGGELVDALRACVRQLPPRGRRLLQRAYGNGDGRAELGRAFGLVPDGVKTALRRLRAALKQCMEQRLRSEP